MAFASVAAATIGAGVPLIMGAAQKRKAKNIRSSAVDPGVQPNYALDRVTQTLFQNYSNWNLPGYSKMMNQIGSNQASANSNIMNAATSSSDILNGITGNQVAANSSAVDLALNQASGKERALMNYLSSVKDQGQDQVRMNSQDNERYQAQLNEAAAMEGAGIQNMNNGFQDLLTTSSAIVGNFLPRQTVSQTTGEVIPVQSVWSQMYGKNKTQKK